MGKHLIEMAPNGAVYIDGRRIIGSKPYGIFTTIKARVTKDDLKELSNRCLEIIESEGER